MKKMKLNIQLFAISNSLNITEVGRSIPNNTTTQRVSLTITRTSGTTYWQAEKTVTFTCDGQTKTTTMSFPSSVTTKTVYQDFVITHNPDGNKTVNYSAKIVTGTSAGTVNPSGQAQLGTIPRYTSITNFAVSKISGYTGINSVKLTWGTADTIDYLWYRYKRSSDSSYSGWVGVDVSDGTSGSFSIGGLTAGTSYDFHIKVRRKDSQLPTESTTPKTQSTYDYNKRTSSVPDSFTNESSLRVTASNPSGAQCNIKLELPDYGYAGIARNNTTDTTFSQSDFASIFSKIPNAPKMGETVKLRVTIDTTNGTNYYYDTIDRPLSLVNTNPVFSNFTYEDTNEKTIALTGDSKTLIVGYSNLKTTITPENKAVAKNYATITGYRTTMGAKFDDASYSDTDTVTMEISQVESGLVNVIATDSRGYATTVPASPNMIAYMPLTKEGTEKGYRTEEDLTPNGVSDLVAISFAGKLWKGSFGSTENEIVRAQYRFKKGTGDFDDYKDIENLVIEEDGSFSYNNLIFGEGTTGLFDIESVYTIEVDIEDKLSKITYTIPVSSGRPHIAYAPNGVSIMGKYDENVGGLFQVGGKRLDAGGDALPLGSIFEYDGDTVPSGYSEVTALHNYASECLYDNCTFHEGYAFKIGKMVFLKIRITSNITSEWGQIMRLPLALDPKPYYDYGQPLQKSGFWVYGVGIGSINIRGAVTKGTGYWIDGIYEANEF